MTKRQYFEVIIAGQISHSLIYYHDNDDFTPIIGNIVNINLRNKLDIGIIVKNYKGEINQKVKYKNIISIVNIPPIPKDLIDFLYLMSDYYMSPLGLAFSLILRGVKNISQLKDPKKYLLRDKAEVKDIKWTTKQKEAFDALSDVQTPLLKSEIVEHSNASLAIINKLVEKQVLYSPPPINYLTSENNVVQEKLEPVNQINFSEDQKTTFDEIINESENKNYFTHLIDGVTGSGKTAIYFELISYFSQKKSGQYLLLLPEISLGQEFTTRAESYFKQKPVFWHSQLTETERKKIWIDVACGKISLIIGARSALFLPFCNLQMIIVDEEHEASYKQEESIRYHARDMAVMRSYKLQIPCILISATPSLESLWNVKQKKYSYSSLRKRFGNASEVEYKIINMVKEDQPKNKFISKTMVREINDRLKKKEQSLLYINRRGFAPILLCRDCGYIFKTPDTDSFLVEHKKTGMLHCHLTDYKQKKPSQCPKCKSKNDFYSSGPAIERIYEEVNLNWPNAVSACFSSDIKKINNVDEKLGLHELITLMKDNKIDIMVATQIAAKGYHFPNLTLVGVIDADMGLASDNLRSNEISYQKLEQVTGRAGRSDKKGTAYLQSYEINHPLLLALKDKRINNFLEYEMDLRQKFNFPPYGKLISIIIQSKDEASLNKFADYMLQNKPVAGPDIKFFGPLKAPIYLLRGKYRQRFLVQTNDGKNIQQIAKDWLVKFKCPNNIQLLIDVDPYNFS